MTENQVELDVVTWLQGRGWMVKRKNVGLFYTKDGRPIHIGRVGECDWYAVHPQHGYIELEVKATGKKPDKRQLEYMAKLIHMGLRAWWVDSLQVLEAYYVSEIEHKRPAALHVARRARG